MSEQENSNTFHGIALEEIMKGNTEGKKTVISRIDLGKTRIVGYTVYDSYTKEFMELTPSETKHFINNGGIAGLMLDEQNEVQLDLQFNRNIMIKSGVGNYTPMNLLRFNLSIENKNMDTLYAVVKVVVTDTGREFELISNKCARFNVPESCISGINDIAEIAGIQVEKDKVKEIHESIPIIDERKRIAVKVTAKDTKKTSSK